MQQQREAVSDLVSQGVSVKAACDAVGLSRASFYRRPMGWRERDASVIEAIQGVLKKAPRSGFWKVYARLRLMGHHFNHKRVYRVYCRLGLNLPRRTKRALSKRPSAPLQVVARPSHQWALDFTHDTAVLHQALPSAQRNRRGNPGVFGHRGGYLVTRATAGACHGAVERRSWITQTDSRG